MKKNTQVKKINVSFVAFSSIFGVLALSAIAFFHIWQESEWVELYIVAMRWLVLPVLALVVGYTATVNKAPKGWIWILPVILGSGISLVEWATYGSFSIVLLGLGAISSLFGFTFAKMDRKEKAREERAAAKKAGVAAEEVAEPEATTREDEYNPGADYVPDENDTWADEVLAEEGYGELKVDYAEPDPDFSIDSPDAANEEREASAGGEDVDTDEALFDADDADEAMPEDEASEDIEPDSEPDEAEETYVEAALDSDIDEADGDDEADADADESCGSGVEETNADEADEADNSASDDSKTINE